MRDGVRMAVAVYLYYTSQCVKQRTSTVLECKLIQSLFSVAWNVASGITLKLKVITLPDPEGTILRIRMLKKGKKVRMKIRWSRKRRLRRK
jgi:hypothetical protein